MQDSSLTTLLDAIEAELHRLGHLHEASAPSIRVTSAFGYGQTPFEQWLGQVFLPNARAAVASNDLPASSQVAVAAFRNFDGMDEANALISLLGSFDAKINKAGRVRGGA
ncbi:MAG: YqcC family protein [Ottowia sp.]|uniref:YqcC family protein n=1 Tax=Ottowia sp. TaxID=1898956 RepID=UPI0039E22F51